MAILERSVVAGWAALAVCVINASPLQAQTPGANAASGSFPATDAGTLEEITVTAEKRSENLQKAPVAVDTASNDTLIRSGAEKLDNLEKVMPDVKIAAQGAAAETISIRGVYSTDNSPTAEQANAVHIDGAYIAKTTGINGMLFDISQIEVAKGPQGTLYGRNANGGAVNIITNKPVIGQDSADVSLEYGSYNLLRASGALGMSLSDTIAVRGAFQSLTHNGYYASGLDDEDEKSARISVLYKPSENQSLLFVGDSIKLSPQGGGINVVGSQPAVPGNAANYYIPPDPRDNSFYTTARDAAGNVLPTTHQDSYYVHSQNNGAMLQYQYDWDWATWTTMADYRKFSQVAFGENNLGQGIVDPATGQPGGSRNYNPQSFTSVSAETRLTSTATKPLQWVAGIYAFHDKDSGTMIGYQGLLTVVPSIQIANGKELAQSYAAFGQLVYTPTGLDALHVTLGGRYNYDHKNASGIFTQFGTSTAPGFLTEVPAAKADWNSVSYRAGVSYDLSDTSLLYANTATGFKSGGFAYGPGTGASGVPEYAPEKIKSYEVGSKNRFLNDTLQVNLEAWYYKYKDYQTNLVLFGVDQVPLPVLTVTTAGDATYKGATIDLQYQLTRYDLLRVDWTAVSARYGSFTVPTPPGYSNNPCPAGCAPGAVLFDRDNTDIPAVPHMSGAITFDHTIPLSRGSLDMQLAGQFHGNNLLDLEDDGLYGRVRMEQHAFWMGDASIRYDSQDNRWNLTAYCHNLTDGLHYRGGTYSTSTHLYTASLYDPRIVGVSFAMKLKL